jgi:RNA polymerase sigma factor (sigma-70 family)
MTERNNNPYDDRLLLDRWLCEHDADAITQLVDSYSGMVYSTCLRILGNEREAEDAAQESFEVLIKLEAPPDTPMLGAWMYGVARNRARKHIESSGRRRIRETKFQLDQPLSTEVEIQDIYDHLDDAVSELPERSRIPLIAHFFEGRSHRSIAELLDVSPRTVGNRIAEGVQQLDASLRKRGITSSLAGITAVLSVNWSAGALGSHSASTVIGKSIVTVGKQDVSKLTVGYLLGGLLNTKAALTVLSVLVLIFAFLMVWKSSRARIEIPPDLTGVNEFSAKDKQGNLETASNENAPIPVPSGLVVKTAVNPHDIPRRGSLRGIVVDASGSPVGGAAVTCLVEPVDNELIADNVSCTFPLPTTTTLSDGSYQFTNLPDGLAVVIAVDDDATGKIQQRLSPGQPARESYIVLARGKPIAGRVVDTYGHPVQGARVFPVGANDTIERLSWQRIRSATSDEGGHFRIPGLHSGAWQLYVVHQDWAPALSGPDLAGTTGVRVALKPGTALHGRVLNKDGRTPLSGLAVSVAPQSVESEPRVAITDDNGAFTFAHLSAGYHNINVHSTAYVFVRGPNSVLIDSEPAPSPIEIVAGPGAIIRGRLLATDNNEGIAGARVRATPMDRDTDKRRVSLPAGTDGSYEVRGLPSGTYTLSVSGFDTPGFGTFEIRKFTREVAVRVDSLLQDVDIQLRRKQTVSGVLFDADGVPVPHALVNAQESEYGSAQDDTYTDVNGRFILGGFELGQEIVVGARSMRGLSGLHGPITIGEDNAKDVRLELGIENSIVVSGQAWATNGKPFDGRILALPREPALNSPWFNSSSAIDEGGNFVLTGLPAGKCDIFMIPSQDVSARHLATTQRLKLGNAIKNLQFLFIDQDTITLTGRVVDESGAPVTNARVQAFLQEGGGYSPSGRAVTDRDGVFIIEKQLVGPRRIEVSSPAHEAREIEVRSDTHDVAVELRSLPRLTGTVINARTRLALREFRLALIPVSQPSNTPTFVTASDPSGKFERVVPHRGRWTLLTRVEGYTTSEIELYFDSQSEPVVDITVRMEPSQGPS